MTATKAALIKVTVESETPLSDEDVETKIRENDLNGDYEDQYEEICSDGFEITEIFEEDAQAYSHMEEQ
ncbi:hypothetical protein [Deinococcus sp. SL84]|uniref:hypothetical protein n=1 Tax=Deinococcus sp. SL84 TaxID=2994663 RepID=UPI002273CCFA|nr:hypothetical protein [Deinococcus sp. SL84]MCY1703802.1 hypothetical protein [Deinococcus sp. SL84]